MLGRGEALSGGGGRQNVEKHISGANMIELQNEQLANCRGFDGETFNYPPVEKVPYCLKLICPFWLLPCPRCLSVSGYPSLLLSLAGLCHPGVSASLDCGDERAAPAVGSRHCFVC